MMGRDWRARPYCELDATTDAWLMWFGPTERFPTRESHMAFVDAELARRLSTDDKPELAAEYDDRFQSLFGDDDEL